MTILPLLCVKSALRPITPEGEAIVLEKEGQVLKVEILTPKRLHTRLQENFWWGPMLSTIVQCWAAEKEWAVPPTKEMVHDRIVAMLWGETDSPLGRVRIKSSRDLTVEEYSQLIEAGKTHLWEKFGVQAPEPREASL